MARRHSLVYIFNIPGTASSSSCIISSFTLAFSPSSLLTASTVSYSWISPASTSTAEFARWSKWTRYVACILVVADADLLSVDGYFGRWTGIFLVAGGGGWLAASWKAYVTVDVVEEEEK
ncbi:unnamed protein product [Linum trigynum]|uniref:Uncharacterized protein n=1 Tax=Linum trigynum TaxID=586398 RepID=A0AAV2GQR8_9ROSI